MGNYYETPDGALRLRPVVNIHCGAREKAERAAGKASSAPITDHLRKQVFPTGRPRGLRPRSLRPLLALVVFGWALFIAVGLLGRLVMG